MHINAKQGISATSDSGRSIYSLVSIDCVEAFTECTREEVFTSSSLLWSLRRSRQTEAVMYESLIRALGPHILGTTDFCILLSFF